MSDSIAHFLTANQDLLKIAADALASAPHFTEAETKSRREAVVHAIMAFLPTEPVQTMLASQAVGYHLSVMEGFREINATSLSPAMAARARMVAVAQTRTVLQVVRELRIVRKGALAAVAV